MLSYTHINKEERIRLQELKEKGNSIREIAREMGRSPSTISRELKRNGSKKGYHYWRAQIQAICRRREKKEWRLKPGSEEWEYIVAGLNQYWSPQAIAGRWKLEHPKEQGLSVSTIYRYIKKKRFPAIREKTHLRRRGKRSITRNANYNTIHPDRIIPDWPPEIKERTRLGDWEGDTIYGGIGKGFLVTLVDRKSRYLLAGLVPSRSPEKTRFVIQQLLHGQVVHSLSLDNGSEFSQFHLLEREIHAPVFFALPHKPWQRGSNENANGILRFFFPKGCDFLSLSQSALDHVLSLINSRPKKCLDWLSPRDLFVPSPPVALA